MGIIGYHHFDTRVWVNTLSFNYHIILVGLIIQTSENKQFAKNEIQVEHIPREAISASLLTSFVAWAQKHEISPVIFSLIGELSVRGIVRSGNCLSGNCPVGEMSVRGNVRSGSCPVGELSGRGIVCRGIIGRGIVRRGIVGRGIVRIPTGVRQNQEILSRAYVGLC